MCVQGIDFLRSVAYNGERSKSEEFCSGFNAAALFFDSEMLHLRKEVNGNYLTAYGRDERNAQGA